MFLWASRKTDAIWVRSVLSGVSSGISRAAEDARDAIDARGFRVVVDDLCETVVDGRADLVEVRPGMS